MKHEPIFTVAKNESWHSGEPCYVFYYRLIFLSGLLVDNTLYYFCETILFAAYKLFTPRMIDCTYILTNK